MSSADTLLATLVGGMLGILAMVVIAELIVLLTDE